MAVRHYLWAQLITFLLAALRVMAPAPVPPLERALNALGGLTRHFSQTEHTRQPLPRPTNCPCFSCGDRNCTPPTCAWCSVRADSGCKTSETPGCYTTASATCVCNLPPGPDPSGANLPANFYFACGQIGGLGVMGQTVGVGTCRCESEWSFGCTNCYRWWSAVSLEASVNYCIAAGMKWNASGPCKAVTKLAESMWAHAPYNYIWDASITPIYIDDFAWYILAYLRVYDWTGDEVWRQRAVAIHDWAWKFGWDHRLVNSSGAECGGFWWSLYAKWKLKDSISIVEMLRASAKIAITYSEGSANRSHFTEKAISTWAWLFAFDGGRGLLASNGIMSTGAVPEWCCAADTPAAGANLTYLGPPCSNSRAPGMSYNHGLLMSSAALLYNLTADKDYLTIGLQLLDAAFENLTNDEGAVLDAQRGARAAYSSSCECGNDPGSDFFSFKGVFAANLAYFASTLRESNVFTPDALNKTLSILKRSSDNAWSRSAVWPPFTDSGDICGTYPGEEVKMETEKVLLEGSPTNTSYPKFHWWWSNDNGSIETPPDASIWFKKPSVFCSYKASNNSSHPSPLLWSAQLDSADECQMHCALNDSCLKYMFNAYSGGADTCPCKTCQNKVCEYPECDWCGTLADNSCPMKNSSGCYTTAAAGCSCTAPGPPVAKDNCFLYGSVTYGNRSNGDACTRWNKNYSFAVKRPVPPSPNDASTTCLNRCGNATLPVVVNGTSRPCHCDSACARHFDCCQDYVEQCLPPKLQHPSCAGHCSGKTSLAESRGKSHIDALGQPIRGGGYCFCGSNCQNLFTDNNSYEGCCGDFASQCSSAVRDPICFDARTQSSALHLFIAHHVVETNGL